MANKRFPGTYDCYHHAQPHEPMFVLLARDRFAGPLVRMWAALRSHDLDMARHAYAEAVDRMKEKPREDQAKVDEALRCANAMEAFEVGEPYCHVCMCTEEQACLINGGPCAWADPEKTICTNPQCMQAAGVQTSTARSG